MVILPPGTFGVPGGIFRRVGYSTKNTLEMIMLRVEFLIKQVNVIWFIGDVLMTGYLMIIIGGKKYARFI